MPDHLSRRPLGDLLADLAAKSPTPGGGAAASAVAALAAALGSMVLAYSVGRKALAEHDAGNRAAAGRLGAARERLLDLAEEDARAYALLAELNRLTPDDPRRRAERPAAVQAAIDAPMQVLEEAARLLADFEALAGTTNRYLRSDLAIAGVLAEAAVASAAWNVRINLPELADDPRRARIEASVASVVASAASARDRIGAACR